MATTVSCLPLPEAGWIGAGDAGGAGAAGGGVAAGLVAATGERMLFTAWAWTVATVDAASAARAWAWSWEIRCDVSRSLVRSRSMYAERAERAFWISPVCAAASERSLASL